MTCPGLFSLLREDLNLSSASDSVCNSWLVLGSKPPCTFQVPTQLKVGGPGSYWPARHSGARAILLQLYKEHMVSACQVRSWGNRRWGCCSGTVLVMFLSWLQNPSGQGFLTKEELLQRCASKVSRVSTAGRKEPSGCGSDPESSRGCPWEKAAAWGPGSGHMVDLGAL